MKPIDDYPVNLNEAIIGCRNRLFATNKDWDLFAEYGSEGKVRVKEILYSSWPQSTIFVWLYNGVCVHVNERDRVFYVLEIQ